MCTTFNKPIIDMAATAVKIKSLRKANGFTVRNIQDVFGFANCQAVYNWEAGKCIPTIDNLLVLAVLFNVSMEDLIVTRNVEIEIEQSVKKTA